MHGVKLVATESHERQSHPLHLELANFVNDPSATGSLSEFFRAKAVVFCHFVYTFVWLGISHILSTRDRFAAFSDQENSRWQNAGLPTTHLVARNP